MPNILTANRSDITVNGVLLEGIQSISFRELREQQDIMAIGSDERVGLAYGATRVTGTMVVASTSEALNQYMMKKQTFQIVANLKKELGTGQGSQAVTFDDCYIRDQSFGLAANGTGTTTYEFTATRIRFE